MASSVVIDSLTARVEAVSSFVPVIKPEAVRTDNNDLPELFQVLVFSASDERRTSLGPQACLRETGTCTVYVYGIAGHGVDGVRAQAETVQQGLRLWQDPSTRLYINSCSQPESTSLESDGRWFGLSFSLEFDRDI